MRNALAVFFLVLIVAGCGDNAPKPPSVEELKAKLQQDDPNLQIEAAAWIKELGPKAAEARPALIAALKSPDPAVRREAAAALGYIGPEAAPAVPALMEALADPEDRVRRAAAESLGNLGPAAAAAIPALENLIAKDNLIKQTDPSKQGSSCSTADSALKKIRK
jgi:HEAT repeat protein